MTDDYQLTDVAGASWVRCSRVVMDNPRAEPAALSFSEERVLNLGDGVMTLPMGNLGKSLDGDMDELFDLLDPDTGAVVGESTFKHAYALIYSAYIHTARERDKSLSFVVGG